MNHRRLMFHRRRNEAVPTGLIQFPATTKSYTSYSQNDPLFQSGLPLQVQERPGVTDEEWNQMLRMSRKQIPGINISSPSPATRRRQNFFENTIFALVCIGRLDHHTSQDMEHYVSHGVSGKEIYIFYVEQILPLIFFVTQCPKRCGCQHWIIRISVYKSNQWQSRPGTLQRTCYHCQITKCSLCAQAIECTKYQKIVQFS